MKESGAIRRLTVHEAPPASQGIAEAQLVTAARAAAIGAASKSFWLAEVRLGRAPAPAIREPRFTRWRLTEVVAYWLDRANPANKDSEVANQMVAHAKRAVSRRNAVNPKSVQGDAAGNEQ